MALPVEYKLYQGSIVFRAAGDTFTDEDLRTGIAHAEYRVAFEIDRIDLEAREGWTVLVRGAAHHVDTEAERASIMNAGVQPWIGPETAFTREPGSGVTPGQNGWVRRQGLEPRTRRLRACCSAIELAAHGAERCYDVPDYTANHESGCRAVPAATGPYRDIRANMEQPWATIVRSGGGYSP